MSRILITGGSGFIGTNVFQCLIKKNHQIVNLDKAPPKENEYCQFWKEVDILDFERLKQTILDFSPEYILHLAARTDLEGNSIDDYSVNIVGVENLLRIVEGLPNLKKIVVTSSMLVCHGGYFPRHQFDFAPTTLYGESKVEMEKLVWKKKLLCDWAILRPTSIWGPWFSVPYKNFFDMVISRRYFHIGNRGCTKTYGYVDNTVYQIEKILFTETRDENNKVFFLGDIPAVNIEDWANEIGNELGFKIPKLPFLFIQMIALFGDLLKFFNVDFPMNSFRLHNMTTDNIVDLSNTYQIAPNPPFSRLEGTRKTLEWIKTRSFEN